MATRAMAKPDVADSIRYTVQRIDAAVGILDGIHRSEFFSHTDDETKRHVVCQALTAFLKQETSYLLKTEWPDGVA